MELIATEEFHAEAVNAYSKYVHNHPAEVELVAVADPDEKRRSEFATEYNIPEEMRFHDWDTFFEQPKMADAVLICTQDQQHYTPAIKAMEMGYDVLLEKPMSPNEKECNLISHAFCIYELREIEKAASASL